MLDGADIVSGIGAALWMVGMGYWLWFICSPREPIDKIRSRSPWHVLGNLTIVGMLIFAAGRVLAGRR